MSSCNDGTWMVHGWYMDGTWMVHGWYMDGSWMVHGSRCLPVMMTDITAMFHNDPFKAIVNVVKAYEGFTMIHLKPQ